MPLPRLVFALNRMLPADVRIVSAAGISPDDCFRVSITAADAAAAAMRHSPPDETLVGTAATSTTTPISRRRYRPPLDLRSFLTNLRKTYRYRFSTGPFQDPTERRTAWHVTTASSAASTSAEGRTRKRGGGRLDWGAMREACRVLEGTHDYRAFQGAPRGSETRHPNATCTLESIRLEIRTKEVGASSSNIDKDATVNADTTADHGSRCYSYTLHVTGDRFLYKMVRMVAGCVVDVGRCRIKLDELDRALRSGSREEISRTWQCAPAYGLALVDVRYDTPLDLEWL
jgi:tRNA pseudouridine38-40 synthase